MTNSKNIIAIVAHHDDIELGCGGTLAKYADMGHNIFGLVLTNSITDYNIRKIVRNERSILKESEKAANILGYKYISLPSELSNNGELKYEVTLMREIEEVLNKYNIDTIFTHWNKDLNTDHHFTSKLAITAGRHTPSILMFRSNWYQIDKPFNGMVFSDISNYMDKKISALNAFSEEIDNRSQDWIGHFINREKKNGFIIDVEYAETFEPVRYLI